MVETSTWFRKRQGEDRRTAEAVGATHFERGQEAQTLQDVERAAHWSMDGDPSEQGPAPKPSPDPSSVPHGNHVILGGTGSIIFSGFGKSSVGHCLKRSGEGWGNAKFLQQDGADVGTLIEYIDHLRNPESDGARLVRSERKDQDFVFPTTLSLSLLTMVARL